MQERVPTRRNVLELTGATLAAGFGVGAVSADDPDPRGEPVSGTAPGREEPTTLVNVWTTEAPNGHWLYHGNGWIYGDRCRDFANNTHQVYSIDGKEFVFDSYDDWEHTTDGDDCGLWFDYTTPPKRVGETYPIRWEFESSVDRYAFWEDRFPLETEVEIVRRQR